jgi:hypothetical protein
MRFEMSGREFTFDGGLDVTADELWALDELGVSEAEIVSVLNGGADERISPARAVRVFCALAYISARREHPGTTWPEFARTIAPGTLKLLGLEPSGLGPALLADQPAEPEAEEKPKPKRAPRAKKAERIEEPAPTPA